MNGAAPRRIWLAGELGNIQPKTLTFSERAASWHRQGRSRGGLQSRSTTTPPGRPARVFPGRVPDSSVCQSREQN